MTPRVNQAIHTSLSPEQVATATAPESGWAADVRGLAGEAFIRGVLYGPCLSREESTLDLRRLPAVGCPDGLPQVLRGCGIHRLLIRCTPSGDCPRPAFWWEGIDGSRVLVRREDDEQETTDTGDLPIRTGELPYARHSLPATHEGENRRRYFLLRDAEFLAAMHPGDAGEYPRAELAEAWTLDREHAGRAREIGEGIVARSLEAFAALLDTGDLSHPVAMWNTLPFPRSGLVSVPWKGKSDVNAFSPRGQASRTQLTEEHGERRLLVEVLDAPPMGYVIYDLSQRARVKASALAVTDVARTDGRVLENELVRVELNERGEIVSFFDKGQKREIIAPGAAGNRFERDGEACEDPAVMQSVERGPLRVSLRVERRLAADTRLVQFIRLEANSRRLDFETCFESSGGDRLMVAFAVAIHSRRATYEVPFGHLDRPTHRSSRDEGRLPAPAHWADLSEGDYGVALLNDGPYRCDAHQNVLRLSLPEAGERRFTYSLLPHRGEVESSGVPLAGYDINVPFRVQPLPVQHGMLARAHSYFRADKPNLIIETVKRAEDGDGLIVRLFEAYRRRGAARLIINGLCSRATRTDLLERNGDDLPVHGGAVTFDYRPFEIITLRLR